MTTLKTNIENEPLYQIGLSTGLNHPAVSNKSYLNSINDMTRPEALSQIQEAMRHSYNDAKRQFEIKDDNYKGLYYLF